MTSWPPYLRRLWCLIYYGIYGQYTFLVHLVDNDLLAHNKFTCGLIVSLTISKSCCNCITYLQYVE